MAGAAAGELCAGSETTGAGAWFWLLFAAGGLAIGALAAAVVEVMKDVGAADAPGPLAGVDAGTDAEALADDEEAAGGAGAAAPPGQRVNVRSLSSGQTLVRTSSGRLYAASHLDSPAGQSTATHDG